MNKKRLWTRGAAWLLTLCLLAGLCVPTVRAEEETSPADTVQTDETNIFATEPEEGATGKETLDEDGQRVEMGNATTIDGDVSQSGGIEVFTSDSSDQTFSTGIDGLSGSYNFHVIDCGGKNDPTLTGPTVSGTTLTAKVKSGRSGIFNAKWKAGRLEITLTYTGTGIQKLSFGCAVKENSGKVTVDGVVPENTFSKRLSNGDSVTIVVESAKNSTGEASITLTNIALEPVTEDFTTTFSPAENGYYTVNEERIVADTSKIQSSALPYNVQVVPNDGYEFLGFERVDTHALISTSEKSFSPTESGLQVRAAFQKKNTALFSVGDTLFYDINSANSFANSSSGAKTIVLEQSGNLAGEREQRVSTGITLLIPSNEEATLSKETPEGESTWVKRTEFRCLTLKEGTKLTIDGALCVNSKVVVTSGAQSSIPSGPYGHIRTEQNAEIIINSNAHLYCWGYITGAGTVTLESGAEAYENFQMAGWRGGTELLKMVNSTVFPLNQYYTQNVEAALQIKSGAKLYVYVVVSLSGTKQETTPLYFGDTGLFRLKEGTVVTRKYDPQTDRITYVVDGNFEISSLELSISKYKLNSEKYVLPLTSNMTVQIRRGTTTLSNKKGAALLPGVVFKVEKGATFQVNCDLFVYDREAWVGKKFSYGSNSSTKDDFEPVKFSPSNPYARKVSDLVDAEIDVNGTLHIMGNLYTTTRTSDTEDIDTFGANIRSSEGTGKVIFNNAPGTATTTQQHIQKDGNKDVPITPAKLKNGSTGEGTKPYTETSGAPAGAVYYYDVDEFGNGSENWYRFNVTYVINGTSDTKQLNTETKLSDVTIDGTIESVKVTVDGGTVALDGIKTDSVTYNPTDKTLTISDILSKVQTYDKENEYKNMGNVTISITTNNKGSSHPMFVLSTKQLRIYQSFGGTATFTELTGDMKGYYLVKDITDHEKQIGGTPCTADDVDMHVPDYDKFGWYMGEGSDAQEFGNVVPGLDGRVVYIYGRYSGYAVEMSGYTPINHQSPHYTTIAEAMSYVTDVGNITYTLKMLADNDAFADDGGKYTIPVNRDITLDLNGFTVTGTITNKGALTIQDSTHSETNDGMGKVTSASNNTITNAGTLTLESGKFVSTGGATAVKNNGTLNVGTGAAFNGKNAASSSVISGKANYPDSYHQLSTSLVDGYFRVVEAKVTITWKNWDGTLLGTSTVNQGQKPEYPTELPTPTRPADDNYKYEFKGWSPVLGPATSATTYTAQYMAIPKNVHLTGSTEDYFETLQDAIDAAKAGDALILLKAVSGSAVFDKDLTLDLNEQTSSGNITVNSGVTLTIKGKGTISASGTAVLNMGTLILPTGITVEATGNNGIALDNSGTIDSITGGTFTGHVAVQIESGGKIGSITGGTFSADAGSTVINNLSTNAVKLSGDPKFGGVTYDTQVLNGVTDTSKFTFEPNMTISTSKSNGYFTIVPNTFTLVFNVDGKRTTKTGVSRSGDVDLRSLYGGTDPTKEEGYQFNGWTYKGTNIGKETVAQNKLGTPGTGETVTVYATWNVVYSVTITWGSLEYDYKGATYVWDGQNMKYKVHEEAHWESVDKNNTVKVTNKTVAEEGTVQVKAKYEKTGGYKFDLLLPNKTSLTTEQMLGTVAPKGASQSWSFLLDGAPSGNAFTKATVGKITLTLQPAT